jgi:hypothetical protein
MKRFVTPKSRPNQQASIATIKSLHVSPVNAAANIKVMNKQDKENFKEKIQQILESKYKFKK